MGYLASAFVFNREPSWQAIASLAPSLALLAVKRRDADLWLLSARPREDDEPQYPLASLLEAPDLEIEGLAPEHEALADALALAVAALHEDHCGWSVVKPAVSLGFALHRALGQPVFYFAANDDGLNLAFYFEGGQLASFRCQGYDGLVELQGGRVVAQPITIEGEESYVDEEALQDELGDHALIDVGPECVVSEDEVDSVIHGVALKLWPAGWADPSKTLGLGTWDVWGDFPAAYDTVLNRA